jgi:uncharacterized protein YndB with AHSA1/START domain
MLPWILVAIAVLLVVFVIVVAMQAPTFRVARSSTIAAPPEAVFAEVNDLRRWEAWNPWGKLDPAMTLTYDGPAAGEGASYAWAGNNKVGQGRMTITDSRPGERVRTRLEFIKPFAATNTAEFEFKPAGAGDATDVTWSMTGERNFMFKLMGLFMSMDKMIGRDFEKGLADLKAVAEASAKSQALTSN